MKLIFTLWHYFLCFSQEDLVLERLAININTYHRFIFVSGQIPTIYHSCSYFCHRQSKWHIAMQSITTYIICIIKFILNLREKCLHKLHLLFILKASVGSMFIYFSTFLFLRSFSLFKVLICQNKYFIIFSGKINQIDDYAKDSYIV